MRATRRRDMGATTYFDIGSSSYFCATMRHKRTQTDQQEYLCFCTSLDFEFVGIEFGFVGEREGKKRVLAGQLEFRADVGAVMLDRANADEHLFSDLFAGHRFRDQK